MKIRLDGEEFTIKKGEWVQTVYGNGEVINTDEVYGTLTFDRLGDEVKVTVEQILKVGANTHDFTTTITTDSLSKFLDENPPEEKAMKEYSKDGVEKPRLSLIPQNAIVEVANVFSYGAKKYNAYNFSKGANKTTYTDAAQRHINRYLLNEDIDVESNLNHLAHAISCLLMLLDNDIIGCSIDDRNKHYG